MLRYAMSDIHGCVELLNERIEQLRERGFFEPDCADELVLLGDYIDRGPDSLGTLRAVMELERLAPGRAICLRGNHDEMFLEWLGVPTTLHAQQDEPLADDGFGEFGGLDGFEGLDGFGGFGEFGDFEGIGWSDGGSDTGFDSLDDLDNDFVSEFLESRSGVRSVVMDLEYRFKSFRQMDPNLVTMRSFLSSGQLKALDRGMRRHATMLDAFEEACRAVREKHADVVRWMQGLRDYWETDKQIFVHAGIDEEAGTEWALGTSRETMLGSRVISNETFYKVVVCGHTPTCFIYGDDAFHDVLRIGSSHIYIDGMTSASGTLPMLVWDSERDAYSSLPL